MTNEFKKMAEQIANAVDNQNLSLKLEDGKFEAHLKTPKLNKSADGDNLPSK